MIDFGFETALTEATGFVDPMRLVDPESARAA
jgi:hypothetical protein